MTKIGKYLLNMAISLDQLLNTVAGGDPDEVVSSRLGKLKKRNNGVIPWKNPLAKLIDVMLEKIDPNHSIDAIEHDEGKNQLA